MSKKLMYFTWTCTFFTWNFDRAHALTAWITNRTDDHFKKLDFN